MTFLNDLSWALMSFHVSCGGSLESSLHSGLDFGARIDRHMTLHFIDEKISVPYRGTLGRHGREGFLIKNIYCYYAIRTRVLSEWSFVVVTENPIWYLWSFNSLILHCIQNQNKQTNMWQRPVSNWILSPREIVWLGVNRPCSESLLIISTIR